VRLVLGLGDQELEQRLRPTLEMIDDLMIVDQCLAADQLLQVAQSGQVDAIVVAWSLHRLTDALLEQLERPGLTLIVLVPDPGDERWTRRSWTVLPYGADAAAIHQALLSSRPGARPVYRSAPTVEPIRPKPADRQDPAPGGIVAVTGGAGSPGRTTVAINLAVALGAGAPTALVEVDLSAPAVAAYLDCDPSRNVCTLAHAVRDDPRLWGTALADELQPIGPRSVSAVVLCGPPKREMRTSVAPSLLEPLVAELTRRFRWIILDVGAELLGMDSAATNHRAALTLAHRVLVVARADLVGIWHTRTALDQLEHLVGIERQRVHLVLNRYDARFHHSRQEVEWHLGVPVAAVIPLDHAAMQRALSEQRPVVLDTRTRAARALLSLAERMNAGKLRLPPEPAGRSRTSWWQRLFAARNWRGWDVRVPAVERPGLSAFQQRRTRVW
jgi:MinD superfamily P-loop ATPase